MEIEKLKIPGLVLLTPQVFSDERGFFMELFKTGKHDTAFPEGTQFMQDNLSYSKKGTIRGLHYQCPPYAQGKLVHVLKGKVLDVAVDLRKDSPTYLQSETVLLDDQKKQSFYLPAGFAHGFAALEDSYFLYKCTNVYDKESEAGIIYNDPTLNIDWKVEEPIVSEKDRALPNLNDAHVCF